MTLKTALCSLRTLIAVVAFGMVACAIPDNFSLPQEIADKRIQLLVLWDTSGAQQAPESLRAFRPGDGLFDLSDNKRLFAVAESSTTGDSQPSLRFERGPWLSLGEFDEQCELTSSGFNCDLHVPVEIADETIFGLCGDERRFQSLRLGCPTETEEKPASVLSACANRIQAPLIDPPVPPKPPVLPTAVTLAARPAWVECTAPLQAPRLADGQCERYVAPCEMGPWPVGEPGDQYVDDDAPAGGNGTLAAPFRAIEEAIGRPGAILLAEGTYQLPSTTQLTQAVRGLCPERTRLVADVHLADASLEQLTLEGVVFVLGEATIENVAVVGRVSTLARTKLNLRRSFVQPSSVDQPAIVSRGTSILNSVAVVAPGAVGVEILAGRVEASGLVVAHARPSVRISSSAGLNLSQSWLHGGQGRPAVIATEFAAISARDVFIEGVRTAISHAGPGSVALKQTTIEADEIGLTSTAAPQLSGLQTAGQIWLEDVTIRTRLEGGVGLRVTGNRLNAQRLQIDGAAVYSIEANNTADISITDLVVNNPGYERQIPDTANPGQLILRRFGDGLHWTTDRRVTSNLTLKRALFAGTPRNTILLGHDVSEVPNDRPQRASATVEDITITHNEASGRRGGRLSLESVDAVLSRLKNESPSFDGSIVVRGRGLYRFEDIDVSGGVSPALAVIQSKDTNNTRKELQFAMRRIRFRTQGPSVVASVNASRLDVEDVEVDSTQTDDPDTFGQSALRFSGPSREPNPLGARIERVTVRSNHQRLLRVDDFQVSVPQLSHISLRYTGADGNDGLHFEDSSFDIDGLRVTGPLRSALAASSDGTLTNPGKIQLRNAYADGPASFYIAVEDPCPVRPERMCNLAIKDAGYLILYQGVQRQSLCD